MKRYSLILVSALSLLLCACGKNTKQHLSIDTSKYNKEIADVLSLSDGVKETKLISTQDIDKIKGIYNENKNVNDKSDVNIDFLLKPFIDELKTDILLKYNNKYYRYEYSIEEDDDYDDENRLSQEQLDETVVLYKDIETLYNEYMVYSNTNDVNDSLLERIHALCEQYKSLSERQKGLIYNYVKLAELVEKYGGSLETNFNLELWKYNTKKQRGEAVGDYKGPSDEELGIVQGNKMYGDDKDKTGDKNDYSSKNVSTVTDNSKITEQTYDVNSASFDDLETELQIPTDFYDCVVDTGNSGTNYIDDEKLYKHIANIDANSLYADGNSIYLRIKGDKDDIPLLNWGTLSYYIPDNEYKDYDIKDSIYYDSGRFTVGLLSKDKKDYRIVKGSIQKNIVYFDNVNDIIPKFEKEHIEVNRINNEYLEHLNELENVPWYEDKIEEN